MNDYPNFIIGGIQKCGTTYLDTIISQHPEVYMPKRTINHNYFCNDTIYKNGDEWYNNIFDANHVKGKVVGQTSADCAYNPDAVKRALRYNPKMKFIFILRDPISRLQSQYWHEVKIGREIYSLENAILKEEQRIKKSYKHFKRYSYVSRSRYQTQFDKIREVLPAEQLMIVTLDRIKAHEVKVFNAIFSFLGVSTVENLAHLKSEKTSKNTGVVPYSRLLQRAAYPLRFIGLGSIMNVIYKLNDSQSKPPEIAADLKSKLESILADDISFYQSINAD